MWTHKERTNYGKQLEESRDNLHRMYACEKVSDKAKEAFNRPLFGGVKKTKDEQK